MRSPWRVHPRPIGLVVWVAAWVLLQACGQPDSFRPGQTGYPAPLATVVVAYPTPVATVAAIYPVPEGFGGASYPAPLPTVVAAYPAPLIRTSTPGRVTDRACATTTPASTPIPIPTDAAIYQAVIRQLVGPDDTFGGQFIKQRVYILRTTTAAATEPTYQITSTVTLSEATQQAIMACLADLPPRIIWVDRMEDVPRDATTGQVQDAGVVLQLGTIMMVASDKVLVPGSIFIAPLAGGAATYVVQQQDSIWRVTGTTGPRAIS